MLLLATTARAEDYTAVEVGSSGEFLHNRAVHQPRHYVDDDIALNQRICTLLADMDSLLARLHALPPQLAGSAATATTADGELAGLYAIALERNPELREAVSELGVLAARTRQAGAKNDPQLELQLLELPAPDPLITHLRETGASVMLSQQFDGYGKRRLRRRIAQGDELLKEYDRAQMELDLLYGVTEAYYNLWGTVAQLRSLKGAISLMDVLLLLAERKYAAGTTPQAQVFSAQTTLTRMQAMQIELSNLRDQQASALTGLLGHPAEFDAGELQFSAPYPLPPAIEWDNDGLLTDALDRRPDYQRLCSALKQQDLMLELARREYRPDYTLSAEYSAGRGRQDTLMAGVSIPLFTHKAERQDAKVQETYALQDVTQARMAALSNSLRTKIEVLQAELAMHSQLVGMYRDALVPQSRIALDSSIAAYSAGMLDLTDLLMAQQSLLTQETELEQNYIHILHTLADLQIVTAGAFDPQPYSGAVNLSGGGTALANPLDLANQALARQAQSSRVGPQLPESPPAEAQLPFVGSLDLPPRSAAPPPLGWQEAALDTGTSLSELGWADAPALPAFRTAASAIAGRLSLRVRRVTQPEPGHRASEPAKTHASDQSGFYAPWRKDGKEGENVR